MLSAKPWDLFSVVRMFGGIFLTLSVGTLLRELLKTMGLLPAGTQEFVELMISTLAFQGAVLFWICFFLREERITFKQAFRGERTGNSRAILLGVGAGLFVLPIAWGLQQLSSYLLGAFQIKAELQPVVQQLQSVQKTGMSLGQEIFFGMAGLILAPIVEEIIFRGILYPTIKEYGYPKLAFWITAILFGLIHWNTLSFIPLTFLAVVLTLLYEETDNLLASIAAHSFFNTANFLFLIFGPEISRLMKQ